MSDETHGPLPSPEWLRDHVEQLRARDSRQEKDGIAEMMAEMQAIGRRYVEEFGKLPCNGLVERVGECSEVFAATCNRAGSPSCPREIIAFDQREERRHLAERLENAGVPRDAILTLTGGRFRITEATAEVDAFLDSDLRTLVLSGDNQVGKSVAGGYAIKRKGGLFVPPSVLDEATDFTGEARALKKRMHAASLLVIDDVGMAAPTARLEAVVLALLVERDNDALRTIVTTNLNADDFSARLGDRRIMARLQSRGSFTPYLIGAPSTTETAR